MVIEAYAAIGWKRYADAGYTLSTDRFGHSLLGAVAYKYFGFDDELIAERVKSFVDEVKREGMANIRGEFQDLNTTIPEQQHQS